MKKKEDYQYFNEELELIETRKIPLEDLKDDLIKTLNYEELIELHSELELLLFLLDLKRYCDFVRTNKSLNEDRKLYRREIKKVYTKVSHLIEKEKRKLPVEVQIIFNEFGGCIEKEKSI